MNAGQKIAWIICDIKVDEEFQIPWRMYAYAEVLKKIGYEPINFFADGSNLNNNHGYQNGEVSKICSLVKTNRPEVAIVYTWYKDFWFLDLLLDNNVLVINRVDSSGRDTFRYHPFDTFIFMTYPVKRLVTKIRAIKFWLVRYLFEADSQINMIIRSLSKSSLVAVGSPGGLDNLKKTIRAIGRPDLLSKCCYIPNPTSPEFFNYPIKAKQKKIIAIADWSSEVTAVWKNIGMLKKIIEASQKLFPDYIFFVVGRGAFDTFGDILIKLRNVVLIDQVKNCDLPEIMSDAQILLVTSRREGAPVVVNEALAMGCTIVSTPLPGVHINCGEEQWGIKAKSFSKSSFMHALKLEIKMWENGKRNFEKGYLKWRSILSTDAIGNKIRTLIKDLIK